MADVTTDEKVTGTPLVPEGVEDDWADVPLSIPSRADVEEATEDETTDTDTSEQDSEDDTQEVEQPEDNIEYVEDPGEYIPSDYSFEVTTFDEEGNKPQSHKITSVEEWDKLMESEPNFGSAAALTKALRLSTKMEANLETDYKNWEAKKADYDQVKATDDAKAGRIVELQNEMAYLVENGDMPKLTKKQTDANWTDPEIAKEDGIKEHVALIEYAEKLAAKRAKAGLKTQVSLIDAFNERARQEAKAGKTTTPVEDKKVAGKARQTAGARVASTTANPVGQVPKGLAVGAGGSLDDLGRGWL